MHRVHHPLLDAGSQRISSLCGLTLAATISSLLSSGKISRFPAGVGITDDLQDDAAAAAGAGQVAHGPHLPSDPTERLAVALGLDIRLLAHHSRRVTGDTEAAISSLK